MSQHLIEWRPVCGYEKFYEVSSDGDVRMLQPRHNCKAGRAMKSFRCTNGYLQVSLSAEYGRRKNILVHRIVAAAFNPNPNCLPQINHLNGVKDDNRAENLEWTTCRKNKLHAAAMGLLRPAKGESHGRAKLTDEMVLAIRNHTGRTMQEIAVAYGVSQSTVSCILNRKTWTHV